MNEEVSRWLDTLPLTSGVMAEFRKAIEKNIAEERSEGYSKGWDDGYAQAETDNAFDNLDLLH